MQTETLPLTGAQRAKRSRDKKRTERFDLEANYLGLYEMLVKHQQEIIPLLQPDELDEMDIYEEQYEDVKVWVHGRKKRDNGQ